jgi:chromosome partitioning protein
MSKIISFIIQKGGCGKTTTTVNIGAYLAIKGFKTLMVDMDPQGNMTQHFGFVPEELEYTIRNVMKKEIPIEKAILKKDDHLHIIGNNILTAGDEVSFYNAISREFLLRDQLLKIYQNYDYVLIDCPPSLGILSLNSLVSSHEMFIVISPDFFPLMALKPLIQTFQIVKENLNKTLRIKGIGITMCDTRTNHAKQVLEIIEKNFPEQVYHSQIRNNVTLKDAAGQGQSIFEYDSNSIGAEDYSSMGEEFILDHISTQKRHQHYDEVYHKLNKELQEDVTTKAKELISKYLRERLEQNDDSITVKKAFNLAKYRVLEKMYPIKHEKKVSVNES